MLLFASIKERKQKSITLSYPYLLVTIIFVLSLCLVCKCYSFISFCRFFFAKIQMNQKRRENKKLLLSIHEQTLFVHSSLILNWWKWISVETLSRYPQNSMRAAYILVLYRWKESTIIINMQITWYSNIFSLSISLLLSAFLLPHHFFPL